MRTCGECFNLIIICYPVEQPLVSLTPSRCTLLLKKVTDLVFMNLGILNSWNLFQLTDKLSRKYQRGCNQTKSEKNKFINAWKVWCLGQLSLDRNRETRFLKSWLPQKQASSFSNHSKRSNRQGTMIIVSRHRLINLGIYLFRFSAKQP